MQVSRRWWMVALLVVAGSALGVVAAPPPWTASSAEIKTYIKTAADALAKASKAEEAKAVRDDIESGLLPPKGGPTTVPPPKPPLAFKRDYAQAIRDSFKDLISNPNPNVALNAMILVAHQESTDCDQLLVDGLTNSSPAIRYWAAKGLGPILKDLKLIGPAYTRAVNALAKAAGEEKFPMVKAVMCEAMRASPDPAFVPPLLKAATDAAQAFEKAAPTAQEMDVATGAFDSLAALAAGGVTFDKAQTTSAAQAAADTMSFAAQRLYLTEQAKQPVTPGQVAAAANVAQAGVRAVNALQKGKAIELGKKIKTPGDLLSEVNEVAGSSAAEPGKIPETFPGTKAPARLK